ncbi:MAG: hypothetical protein CUN56_12540 [Phototrophicales bacterium]|nr:MAG: hypothetical protein CUN56_12540 [Phototrophicales bacterium]RMG70485.1 MAG: LysR family transcriptional regulator [Chloroflexota bacterium]
MELGQLEAFERTAREGSFTRAAEELGLTQPSVSARIAALERELGGELFERGGRRLRLTALGEAFLPYVERTLALLADGVQSVKSHIAGQLGQVAIASLDTTALYMLPEPMKRFRTEYPSVDFTIKLRMNHQIIDALYDGDVTLGLMGAPLWDKNIKIYAHFQEPVRAIAAAHHPLAELQRQQGYIDLENLYEHTIYRVTLNPRITAMVEGIAEQARKGSGGALVYVPSIMTRHLLYQGSGVAILPEQFLMQSVREGVLTYLTVRDMPMLYNETLLVGLRGRELNQPSQAFVQMLRAQWRDLLVRG